ncbi:hypothetical protein CL1_0394 [Thermococcus cleftensis]|uniref:DUF1850 domain-containing protein n=1 Tax=Thermococcus cleftensis (strain DSM 27260 / KACC 17922 / CL1) TaxID=163003 RepID=I3ZSC1_THECF|nr:DUF1850 domain-containing protein [Thermococcus cleftensis]AFL94605.1 hypothetical protein CL1_0394 [Thermococcus cleftensis]
MSRKALSFLIITVALVLLLPVNAVEISFNGRSYTYSPGSTIEIEYVHSVERSEVVEIITANGTGFYVVEMRWKDFGAGLPEDVQNLTDGFYVKRTRDYLGRSFTYWFIPINHANVTVNGSPVLVDSDGGKKVVVNFQIKRVPLVMRLIGRW